MRIGRPLLVGLVTLLSVASESRAQAVVVVDTNVPNALVYADSSVLGRAHQATFRWPAGADTLRLLPTERTAWAAPPLTYTIPPEEALTDTLYVRLHWPYQYRIESLPFGASVALVTDTERVLLGETPLQYEAPEVPAGVFQLEADGYVALTVEPGTEVWNHGVYELRPLELTGPADTAEFRPRGSSRRWVDLVAGAVVVVGGVLAVDNKLRADRRYDDYLATGDRSLLDQVRRFDTRAAVSLGGMQVGVGVLAVRLVLR